MGFRINVRNCKRANVTANTTSSYTIDTPVAMPTLRSIDMTVSAASGELYGDGEIVAHASKITGASVAIAIDKLTQADKAALLGATLSNDGILTVKTTDTAPRVAIYFEIEHDDGGFEAYWFLAGQAAPVNVSATQREANISYGTEQITVNFIRREKDKALYKYGDTDNADFTSVKQAAFATNPDT